MMHTPLRFVWLPFLMFAFGAAVTLLGAYTLRQARIHDLLIIPPAASATTLTSQYVQAWQPFTVHEDGVTLRCVADANAETLEPMAMAVAPTPTPGAIPYGTYSGQYYNYGHP